MEGGAILATKKTKTLDKDQIEKDIKDVMKILNIDYMPSRNDILGLEKYSYLEPRVEKTGGFKYWANRLGIQNKVKSMSIKEEDIPLYIKKIMDELKITKMPSRSDIISIKEFNWLHNKICRTGGYRFWANELNLEIKDSETKIGQNYEDVATSMLQNKGFTVEKMTTKHPFDLLVNGCVKIDVKAGHAYDLKGSRCHTFALNKKNGSCDLYLIIALSEDGEIERSLVIPSHHLKVVTLSIGENSKYNKYIGKFDLIRKYSDFYKSLSI